RDPSRQRHSACPDADQRQPVGAAGPLDDLVGDPGQGPVDPGLVEHLRLLPGNHHRLGRALAPARGDWAATPRPETEMPSPSSRKGLMIAAVVIASPCEPHWAHLKELPQGTLRGVVLAVKRSDVVGGAPASLAWRSPRAGWVAER